MAPILWYLGILGMTGLTAYLGLLKIGELKGDDGDNNTIFVSAASGAVGSSMPNSKDKGLSCCRKCWLTRKGKVAT